MSLFSKMLHYYDSNWYLQNTGKSGRKFTLTFHRHQLMIAPILHHMNGFNKCPLSFLANGSISA